MTYLRKTKEHIFSKRVNFFHQTLEELTQETKVSWQIIGDDLYENISWGGEGVPPTKEQVETLFAKTTAEWESKEYQRKRELAYPDIVDYIDGIVKGDQNQIQTYIDKCIAVKSKYPKL